MRPNVLARLIGAITVLQIFIGSFPLYVRSQLIVGDNAEATVENVLGSELLFRLGMLSEVLVSLTWLSMAFVLYVLFRQVQKELALLFLLLVAVGVTAININAIHISSMLSLLQGTVAVPAFDASENASLGMVLFTLFRKGEIAWSLFAGLWLIPLGYVVYKSNYVPRLFGILLMVASLGYVLPSLFSHVFPDFATTIGQFIVFSGLVEVSFGLWLLIRGVNTPRTV